MACTWLFPDCDLPCPRSSMQPIFSTRHPTEIAFIKVDSDPAAKWIDASQSLSYVTLAVQNDDSRSWKILPLISVLFFLLLSSLWTPIIVCPFLELSVFLSLIYSSLFFLNVLCYIKLTYTWVYVTSVHVKKDDGKVNLCGPTVQFKS